MSSGEDPAHKSRRELIAAVRAEGFLVRLPPEIVDAIIDAAHVVQLPVGAVITPIRASIVLSGVLGYMLFEPDGRQVTIRYVGSGELVGTLSASESPLTTGIEVVEPSSMLQLDSGQLRRLASTDPDVALAMVEELSSRLRDAYRTLATMSFGNVRSRVANDLLRRARAGGGPRSGQELHVTQQELAQSVGSVREMVSGVLGQLRDTHVIASRRGSIAIVDPAALLREAHPSSIER